MNSSQQGKIFNNSLQKYINSVKNTLPNLQEPFKVARNVGGVKRILHSSDEDYNENHNKRSRGNHKNNQFRELNRKFNQDLLKYTQAFNDYNEQLIQHNYAEPGSTATLLSMNNQLVKTAEQIHDSVDIMNIMDKNLKKALKEKKKQLHNSILALKEQQKKLQKIKYNNTTLDASFNDNQRMSDSTNLKYLLFLIGTLILLVTLYKLNRSL